MEWIITIVVVVMLAIFLYTVLGPAREVSKKYEPAVDAVFEGIHTLLDATSEKVKHDGDPDASTQSESKQ